MWSKAMIFNVVMQASVLVPLIVALLYRIRANQFYKLLIASLLLSLVFDAVGDILIITQKNNIWWYCGYLLISPILMTAMWSSIPSISQKMRKVTIVIGLLIALANWATGFYFEFTKDAMYIMSSLVTFLTLAYALIYYFSRIINSDYSPPIKDPYFIFASAYLLYSLATITITVMKVIFDGENQLSNIWTVRQIFYLIYNAIIAVALYAFYRKEIKFK